MTTPDLRERVIREITVAPGWNKEDATVLVDDLIAVVASKDRATIERLTRALRVNTHSPHDQAGDPIEGFPVCSVCGAIQTLAALAQPEPLDPRLERAYTLLISSVPALFRAHKQSPNDTAVRLNAMLHDSVIEWLLDYQAVTGRGDQGLARLSETPR